LRGQKGIFQMTDELRRRSGRKPIEIDLGLLEKLCMLQCTDEELAGFFNVSTRTIEKRRKHPEFAEVMQRGRAKGRISVRRAQMKLLENGNGTMGVWLGKQMLGQRDAGAAAHTGSAPEQFQPLPKPDLSRLTDTELDQLRELVLKTQLDPTPPPDVNAPDTKTSEEKTS
jgi:hypothetical protein